MEIMNEKMLENKVIISLDEYLDLRDKAQKIDKLRCIGKIVDEDEKFFSYEYNGFKVKQTREIIISEKNLTEYINDILGVSGFEVRIEFEKSENNG